MTRNPNSIVLERQIEQLERLAARVLEEKRRTRPRRPIVIEFCGSPKSGKTTAIGSLDIFLRRNGFRTKILTERASVSPIPNKFDPVFNVWTGCAALNQLMESLASSAKRLDVIIMDRGFFDTLCWFEWQREHGLLRDTDYRRFIQFFTSPRFRMVIDLVLSFEASPTTSIDREYRYLLTRKEGSIMKSDVLGSYLETIGRTRSKYGRLFREIVRFNTNSKNQEQASYEVTLQTLEKLKAIADERIGYVRKDAIGGGLSTIFRFSDIRKTVSSSLNYGERNDVENNSSYLQLLPIAVIKDKNNDRIIVARKSEKAVSRKSPERNRILSYFGGHVREEDANFLDDPDPNSILKQCVYREVKEEIGIDVDPLEDDPWCIWVRDGTRSEQHLAIVYLIECELDLLRLTVDGDELVRYEKKGKIGTGEMISLKSLKRESNMDSWSRNIIDNIIQFDRGEDYMQPSLFGREAP